MLNRNRNIVIILCVLCLLIILPSLIYGYVYPTGGDDSAEHIRVMERITLTHPIPVGYLYNGQWMVGYPLVVLKTLFGIPLTTSFMWFNYLVLIGVVLTLYFVFSRIFNSLAGITAAIGIFAAQTFVAQFLSGLIFNIISIGIILMWLLYFGIRAWTKRSWKFGIVAVILLALFVNFHASGAYIPITPKAVTSVVQGFENTVQGLSSTSNGFILQYAMCLALFLLAVGALFWYRKRILENITKEGRLMMVALGVFGILLIIVSAPIFKISLFPSRQLTDAVTIVFLLAISGLSAYIGKASKLAVNSVLITVMVLVGVLWLPAWFKNNSVIRTVDKEAIAYVNNLGGGQFYGNEYVAPWIYERYLNKKYMADSNVYIWRSAPMTMRTDPLSEWYWKPKDVAIAPPDNIKTMVRFEDNGIEIYVAQGGD